MIKVPKIADDDMYTLANKLSEICGNNNIRASCRGINCSSCLFSNASEHRDINNLRKLFEALHNVTCKEEDDGD